MAIERDELQVFVEELEIGMFVTRLDRPWEETGFLFQGFLVESQEDIESLREKCKFVFIETKHTLVVKPTPSNKIERRKGKRGLFARKINAKSDKSQKTSSSTSHTRSKDGRPSKKIQYINKVSIESEFPKAKQGYGYAKELSKNIMDGIRIGRNLDMNESKAAVRGIVDSIIRNSNALVWLSKLKNKDEYTAEHSLNVCILSVAFARHLGHSEHEIRKIGLCGLLHDVGKAKIPLEILNKPGRFTDEECEIMNQHPLYGRDLLMAASNSDHSAVDVAYSHHERMDEKGYPRKLMQHQIPYYAKLVALVDAYDAITSSRCYDAGRSSMDALDIIYKCKGKQFDEALSIEFIKCIGIYPPGSIVEMSSGEVAIIIASNQESKLKPRVILVLDHEKNKCKEKIIDLRLEPKDPFGEDYKIIRELPNGKYGVHLKEYMEKGLSIEKPKDS
jgi:HD-GYP domain-containing protein (c-di-GMP phosphodiesterase class II)